MRLRAFVGIGQLDRANDHLQQPDDEATMAATPDDLQYSLDGLIGDVAALNAKIDAVMVAMLQLKGQ